MTGVGRVLILWGSHRAERHGWATEVSAPLLSTQCPLLCPCHCAYPRASVECAPQMHLFQAFHMRLLERPPGTGHWCSGERYFPLGTPTGPSFHCPCSTSCINSERFVGAATRKSTERDGRRRKKLPTGWENIYGVKMRFGGSGKRNLSQTAGWGMWQIF